MAAKPGDVNPYFKYSYLPLELAEEVRKILVDNHIVYKGLSNEITYELTKPSENPADPKAISVWLAFNGYLLFDGWSLKLVATDSNPPVELINKVNKELAEVVKKIWK